MTLDELLLIRTELIRLRPTESICKSIEILNREIELKTMDPRKTRTEIPNPPNHEMGQ